ncbi:hypothetical protein OVA29_12605 [Exiguobacterium sp. SL14]|nr:hypothetical protein [Exiguobacterium sp. SL14]MCY1691427.1 hypothetical protein [Exiguobacterium sp. SL14]
MKTYIEEHSDATRVFPWLADASSSIRCLCVVGEMLLFPEEIVQFKQTSSEMFRNELRQKHELRTYRFYLVVCVGNGFQSKRIFDYYKLWRLLEREEMLDGFTSRIEVLRSRSEKNRITSVSLNLVSNSFREPLR